MATLVTPPTAATAITSPATPAARPAPLGRLVRHEWQLLRSDRFATVVALLCALLLGFAVVQGLARRAQAVATLATLETEYRTRVDSARAQLTRLAADSTLAPSGPDPRSPSAAGNTVAAPWATLPPGPLMALATGQSDLVRPYTKVTLQGRQAVVRLEQLDNPLNLLDGGLDLAVVLLYLLPLVVIALAYGLLAEEREQGTLALVLSQPVRVGRLVLAKLLVRGGLVWAIAVLAILGGASVGGAWAAPGGGAAIALWLVAMTVWVAFWLALAVWINSRGRSSATNALWLVAAWLVLVVVLPAAVNAAAQWRHPAPSRVALIGAMREASNAANARGTELLKQFYGDHPELAPAGTVNLQDFETRRLVVQNEINQRIDPLLTAFGTQLAAQQGVVQQWQWLSPAIALHTALLEAAGTGLGRHRAFEQGVTAFHTEWVAALSPRILAKRRLTATDYATLPRWRWQEPVAPWRDAQRALVVLLLAGVAAGVAAWRSVRRVSPLAAA